METQLLNNQIYNQQQFAQRQQNQAPAQNNQTYGGAKDVAISNTNAGYVASKFDVMKHPAILIQNTILGLAAAIGITRFADFLVTPNMSKVKEGATHAEAFEQTPMYRIGQKLDGLLEKVPGFNAAIKKLGEIRQKITKTAGKSEILSAIGKKYHEGSKVKWSMGIPYEEGKGSEAMGEFIDFLEKAPENAFSDKKTKDYIDSVLKEVKDEKISRSDAGKKIIENGCMEKMSAKYLDELPLGESKGVMATLDKVFATTPNLQTGLSKAKFFNQATKKLGPVSRALNSLSLMMMEGVGGGVIGGKGAMIMSIMGLVSAFNACSKANIAKQEKQKQLQNPDLTDEQRKEIKKGPWSSERVAAFMEDFAGFTLGGYLMTYPIGVALNKFAGVSHLARDEKKVKAVAGKLGVQGDSRLFQRSTIKYNETLKQHETAKKYLDVLEGRAQHSLFTRTKRLLGFAKDEAIQESMTEKLKLGIDPKAPKAELIKALKGKLKSDSWFDETRKQLKEAAKSQLTIGSIFKENSYNKGGFFKRLGRFAIQKPLELSAKILGIGKNNLFARKGFFTNALAHVQGLGGGVGRVILVGMVLTVPFRNAFMKVSHHIFGKPSFSQYDEVKGVYEEKEKEEAATKQAASQVPQAKIKLPTPDAQPILQQQQPAYQQQVTPSNPYEANIKPAEKEIQPPDKSIRNLDTYTYIPKS